MQFDASHGFGSFLVSLGLVTEEQVGEAQSHQQFTDKRLGETLIALGHITAPQLRRALDMASGCRPLPKLATPKLGEVLVAQAHFSERRLESALQQQAADPRPLGELLVERGDCTYQEVFDGLADQRLPVTGRLLVVDDSALACTMLVDGLSELGYGVVACEDPLEALDQVARLKPDLVVTDLDMPELDGAELCRRIKVATRGQVPVIILTANAAENAVSGLQAGADDYVRKGTSMAELAARITGILRRTKAAARVRELFARYTSDAVVEQVLDAGDVVLYGEKREVTLLFADIRSFTPFAESHDAELVMATLNDVLGQLADAVLAYGGTIDKFLGDGQMAVFGAPIKRDDDPQRALDAADKMIEATRARNRTCSEELRLEIGVALNTGPVICGSLGSTRRTEYTCIGDPVNVAARLCALAEPNQIVVGEGTLAKVGAPVDVERLESVAVKGRTKPIRVLRLAR